MSSMTSKDVISALSFCFSILSTPEEIICGNARNFTSREYKEFVTNWGFILSASSPHYPTGHGFNGRQVQTIKKLFARCDEDNTNYYLPLYQLLSVSPRASGYPYQQQYTVTSSASLQ